MRSIGFKDSLKGKVAGLAAAATVMVVGSEANAQTTLGTISDGLDNQLDSVAKVVTAGCVVGGLGLCGLGLTKLKAASDSQGREPYSPGLWRLGVGAGLVGLSQTVTTLRNTIFGDASANQMNTGGALIINN